MPSRYTKKDGTVVEYYKKRERGRGRPKKACTQILEKLEGLESDDLKKINSIIDEYLENKKLIVNVTE